MSAQPGMQMPPWRGHYDRNYQKTLCSNQFYILNVANAVLDPQLGDTGNELFGESIEAGKDSEREKHKRDHLGSWMSKSKDIEVVSTGGVSKL